MLTKKIFSAFLFVALASGLAFAASADSFHFNLHPKWEFESLEGWTAGQGITEFKAEDGKLIFSSRGFSYIISPPILVNSEHDGIIRIRMKSSEPYSDAAVFWATNFDRQFDIRKNIPFSLRGGDKFRAYTLSMKKHRLWADNIMQIIISPSQNAGRFEIDYIGLERASLVNRFASGWQEFFSYETIKMRTVNGMTGQTLGGKRINYWIYWTCFALFLLSAAKSMLFGWKKENTFSALKKALHLALAAALIFWAALGARMMIDHARTARLDLKTYGGKTLEDKIAASISGDFYEFIKFTKAHIPDKSLITAIVPSHYYRDMAAYQLYPLSLTEKDGSPYIIVYHPDQKQAERIKLLKGYSLLAKFRDGEYILAAEGKI